jgi:hypothetical protein
VIYLVVAGVAASVLVVIYMARPRFPRVTQSAAIFFRDQQVLSSERKVTWSRPHPTRMFYVQMLVILMLFASILSYYFASFTGASRLVGLWIIVDTSASMSTRQGDGTRMSRARAEVSTIVEQPSRVNRCFRVSAVDLEHRLLAEDAGSAAEALRAISTLAPRALGSDLTIVRRAIEEARGDRPSGCRVDGIVVVTDLPAPPWMDGPASRGDTWIDVSQPVGNIGLTDITAVRDQFNGGVERIRVHVEGFGGTRDQSVLRITGPGASREHRVTMQPWKEQASVYEFAPEVPGRYRIALASGGAYAYDDAAEIEVPAVDEIRVDWRVGRNDLLVQLGWTHDQQNPDLRVVPIGAPLDDRPTIVIGGGYERRTATLMPVSDFVDASPLLSTLNFDVAERAGMSSAAALAPGFDPVLRGDGGALWIAQRGTPPAVYVPGIPLDGDDTVSRFSTTVFLNAARWLLLRRPMPPLFRLTSPSQIQPTGTVIALHPGEGNTGRQPRSIGTVPDPASVVSAATAERRGLWPWLLLVAIVAFLVERWLLFVRGWQ